MDRQPRGRTSWRRLISALGVSFAAVAALLAMAASGGIALAFTGVSGAPFTVTASSFAGSNLHQYGNVVMVGNTPHQVVEVTLDDAKLTNMQQTICVSHVAVVLTAGDNGTPAEAKTLVADITSQTGDITLTGHVTIGASGNPGLTTADSISVANQSQSALYTSAASFTLPHAHLSLGTC